MKKKLFALIMAMVMTLSLAACGGDNDSGKGAAAVDTNTVAVGAVIIARDDIPEDDVYAFVSSIFENTDALSEQHDKGKELDLDFASSVTSVPYHPGAAKYFAEKGKTVAATKSGAGTGSSRALTFGTGGVNRQASCFWKLPPQIFTFLLHATAMEPAPIWQATLRDSLSIWTA